MLGFSTDMYIAEVVSFLLHFSLTVFPVSENVCGHECGDVFFSSFSEKVGNVSGTKWGYRWPAVIHPRSNTNAPDSYISFNSFLPIYSPMVYISIVTPLIPRNGLYCLLRLSQSTDMIKKLHFSISPTMFPHYFLLCSAVSFCRAW